MKGIHFPLLYKRLTFSSLKSHFPLCLFPSPCYSDRKPNVRNWVSPGDDFFPLPHHCTKDITIFAFIVTFFFFFFWQPVSLSKWDSLSGLDHVVLFFFKLKKKIIYLFLATLGLSCCTQAFSSCSKCGLLSSYGMQASHCRGFSYRGA